ncbi:MBL fold metallo-hydrolase [Thermosynechococcus sichuanensis E542]|uniref:MBL fold metallo-hydrolase n=1 Tax=Thermosynechococcus sichuanensis E542 TaxID=2016101 RepID=A0A7D6F471_9CYAN|nr:MBL fold metallo-hydrolase [Thermosynechococcus vestitus]QLL29863.1 MBL fold metallo-hydrolase [Thermosynechococcus vestitus E542]
MISIPVAQQQKPPRLVLPMVYGFPPNRETLGGTAYLIVENDGNTLIDSPPWTESSQNWLREQGGVQRLILTHRGAIARVREMQRTFNCEVIIHAQEAYLLPQVTVTPFNHHLAIGETLEILWTPGHSPGSACVYWSGQGGVLFTGRHLLPTPTGELAPIKTATTFHWPRQLRSVEALKAFCRDKSLSYLCAGANIGFLRGTLAIANAQAVLQGIPLDNLLANKV